MPDLEALTRTERKSLSQRRPRIATSDHMIEVPEVERGLLRRAGAAAAFSLDHMEQLVNSGGFSIKNQHISGETHVELSAAVPYVEGRGWLEAAGMLQSWFPTTNIGFIPTDPSQEQGVLYIWMDGLTPGDAYLVEIRVGGWSASPGIPGTFNIGASDSTHVDIQHSGASQNLGIFMPGVQGELSLIRIDTKGLGGWLFDEVKVTHLGTLQ